MTTAHHHLNRTTGEAACLRDYAENRHLSDDRTAMNSDHDHHRPDADSVSNRPKSVSEVRALYARYADWIHRLEWLDRAVTGRYRRARFGDVNGRSDVRPIATYQEWRGDAHCAKTGCRWTKEPRESVSEAGLEVRDTSTGLFGTSTTFEIVPNGGEER